MGRPKYFLSDNGTEFVGKDLTKPLAQLGSTHTTTPPYHPQSNPVARVDRSSKPMIGIYAEENHPDWDQHLPELASALNAFLNMGRAPTLPSPYVQPPLDSPDPPAISLTDLGPWKTRMDRMIHFYDLARKFIRSFREAGRTL